MQKLQVALTTGGEELGRKVTLGRGGGRGAVVDDDEKAGAVEGRPAMKAVGGVVEDGRDGRYSVLVAEARVVLVGEIQAVGEGEGGGVGVTELPEDGTIGAGDFVDGGGVASGDEVVAGVVFVDRIDVEVVPGEGGVKASARRFSRVGDNLPRAASSGRQGALYHHGIGTPKVSHLLRRRGSSLTSNVDKNSS